MPGNHLAGAGLHRLGDGRPSERFIHFVDNVTINNAYGGVFRSTALSKDQLERRYPGSDIILLAELALYGPYVIIPQVLQPSSHIAPALHFLQNDGRGG